MKNGSGGERIRGVSNMRICPFCGTFSIAGDMVCLNCDRVYELVSPKKKNKEYGFLDFIRGVAITMSIMICGLFVAFVIYEKFFNIGGL
jgi:hypothetical protein